MPPKNPVQDAAYTSTPTEHTRMETLPQAQLSIATRQPPPLGNPVEGSTLAAEDGGKYGL